eukprot:m.350221 g.350221  ORF g.350221 m.350221 type:complete len:201 (-) comp16157_c0_seq15:2530-3132(-)
MGNRTALSLAGLEKYRMTIRESADDAAQEGNSYPVLGVDLSCIVHMLISRHAMELLRCIDEAAKYPEALDYTKALNLDAFVWHFHTSVENLRKQRPAFAFCVRWSTSSQEDAAYQDKAHERQRDGIGKGFQALRRRRFTCLHLSLSVLLVPTWSRFVLLRQHVMMDVCNSLQHLAKQSKPLWLCSVLGMSMTSMLTMEIT